MKPVTLISLLEKAVLDLPGTQLQALKSRLDGLQQTLAAKLDGHELDSQSEADDEWLETQADMLAFHERERTEAEPAWDDLLDLERLNPFCW